MQSFDKLSMSEPKDGKLGMKFYNIFGENGPPCLKVPTSRILFEPSVYNGTGDEPRKNIVFEITEESAKQIEEIENWTRVQTGIPLDKWVSCLKRAETPRLKAKINMSGSRVCEFLGPEGQTNPPDSFRNRAGVVAILIRGVYLQRQATGLMIDVVALKYDAAVQTDSSYLKMIL
jgi:hypothetical protein